MCLHGNGGCHGVLPSNAANERVRGYLTSSGDTDKMANRLIIELGTHGQVERFAPLFPDPSATMLSIVTPIGEGHADGESHPHLSRMEGFAGS